MEPAREPPWGEHEKVYLLAEIIKAHFPSQLLLNIVRENNVQPKWTDIPLPPGRSLRSCQMAFNELNATVPGPDYRPPRQQLPAPMTIYPAPLDTSKKRPHQPEVTTPLGRLIQPRPPQPYPGEFVSGPAAYTMPQVGEPATKKKRGRPTKAEMQARAEAAAARGEVYPAPRKGRASTASMTEPPVLSSQAPGPSVPSSAPQHMGSVTPQQPQAEETRLEDSSGKRKRAKPPAPLELDKPPRDLGPMQSPSLGHGSGDPSSHSHSYSSYTPVSAPLRSGDSRDRDRDRDVRMEGVEETQMQPRTTTPHSFKDTVGI